MPGSKIKTLHQKVTLSKVPTASFPNTPKNNLIFFRENIPPIDEFEVKVKSHFSNRGMRSK